MFIKENLFDSSGQGLPKLRNKRTSVYCNDETRHIYYNDGELIKSKYSVMGKLGEVSIFTNKRDVQQL